MSIDPADFTIMVAEKDVATRTFLIDNLNADGFCAIPADGSRAARVALQSVKVDLVIAALNGETLDLLTEFSEMVPIIVLGASDELDRIRKLDHGAAQIGEAQAGRRILRALRWSA